MRIRSALLGLGLLSLAANARAVSLGDPLLSFPLPPVAGAPDLSDRELFQQLSKGEGYDYAVTRTFVHNPSGNAPDPANPATWTVLTYTGTVTYLPDYEPAYGVVSITPANLVLVLTSLREGVFTPGSPLPPFVLGGYVESTLADDGYFFVRDRLDASESPSAITDEEGEYFLALDFPLLPGQSASFEFQIALRETLEGTLQHFNRGFVAVPEPGPLATLGLGLALLSALRRTRAQK